MCIRDRFSSVGSVGAATVKISCVLLSFSSDDAASDSSFFDASVLLVIRYTDAPRPDVYKRQAYGCWKRNKNVWLLEC